MVCLKNNQCRVQGPFFGLQVLDILVNITYTYIIEPNRVKCWYKLLTKFRLHISNRSQGRRHELLSGREGTDSGPQTYLPQFFLLAFRPPYFENLGKTIILTI